MVAKYDVVACGSATVDVFANTESELIEIKTSHSSESLIAYPSGSKILINDLLFEIGGGGTNTSVGFARMGLSTGYLGCLGDDENAIRIENLMKKEKIDFLGHKVKHLTGYSVILDSIEHDRTILTFKGANNFLDMKKIPKQTMSTKWFYFASMMEKSFMTQKKIAVQAKAKGIRIAYNPSEYQAKQGYNHLKPILDATTILILNKEEAGYIAGFGTTKDLVKRLHDLGIPIVCVTDGPADVYASDGETLWVMKPTKSKVVETTGAGDAFAAGFVSEYIKSGKVNQALCVGLANSESVITHYGAKNILLSYRKAHEYVKEKRLSTRVKKVLS
jgi:ribokinase